MFVLMSAHMCHYTLYECCATPCCAALTSAYAVLCYDVLSCDVFARVLTLAYAVLCLSCAILYYVYIFHVVLCSAQWRHALLHAMCC